MKNWIQEQSYEGIYIKMDDGAKTPVANIAVPMGWRDNPKWKASAEKKANLVTAAPFMLHALKIGLKAICVEDVKEYDIVEKAIRLAERGEE